MGPRHCRHQSFDVLQSMAFDKECSKHSDQECSISVGYPTMA